MKTTDSDKGLGSTTLETLRERLLVARQEALTDLGVTEDDLSWIERNREVELEQRAQDEAARDVLSRREEQDYRRVRAIQDALDRIADGTYGLCVGCGDPIRKERLLAMPEARMCTDCAEEAEGNWARKLEAESAGEVEPAHVPRSDLVGLSDSEVIALIRERFRNEMGTALDGVRILCRHGAVTLVGETSSDELRQVALRILEEELGVEAVDRVRVGVLEGDRSRVGGPAAAGERADDVFDTAEQGGDYTPPARPVAEKE